MQHKVLVLLGGGLINDKGHWRTTSFEDGDNFGAMGDRVRVEAVAVLVKQDPSALIIVSGGKGQNKDIDDAPTVAAVNSRELNELGIPHAQIVLEEQSNNSWQQLNQVAHLLEKEGCERLILVSNRWHLARLRAMAERIDVLQQTALFPDVQFVSAEDILIKNDPATWTTMITEAYESDAIKDRIRIEEKGVRQIVNGTYRLN